MYSYNKYISKIINSSINKATAYDSLNDAIATSAVIITTIIGGFVDFPIDGLVGVAISFLILYTGFSIAKDTVNLLLGSSPDPELVDTINSSVIQGKYIIGTHNLKVHDYGPGRVVASIHAEVPDNANIVEIHSVINELEEKIADELGINIVIHMDPISTDIDKIGLITASVSNITKKVNENFSIQNLRVADEENRITVIFDLLVPQSTVQSEYENIRNLVTEKIVEYNSKFHTIINVIKLND